MRTSHKMMFGLVFVALAAMFAWGGLGWTSWVQSWVGVMFKTFGGAAAAYIVVRYVFSVDLSKIEDPLVRAVAGSGVLIFCAVIGHAIATGA